MLKCCLPIYYSLKNQDIQKKKKKIENFREILFEFRKNGLSKMFVKNIEFATKVRKNFDFQRKFSAKKINFKRKLEFFFKFNRKSSQNSVRIS